MLKPPTLPEPPPPSPPVDENVIKLTLKRLQALVKGNGVKPDQVKLISSDAKILSFDAHAFIRLTTEFKTRTEAGRNMSGEQIGSTIDFDRVLKNMTVETQRNPAKRKNVVDAILKRPDKGFGARDQIMKVEGQSRDFVSHQACASCQGGGQITCSKCGGQKAITCQTCHGRHNILCPNCRGRGSVNTGNRPVTCTRCQGRTRITCPGCQGRGQIPCRQCGASGRAACGNCKGTGWISHLAHVEMINHLHFDYDRQGLPIELSKKLDAFGQRHAEEKDLELSVETSDYTENEALETIPVKYRARIPYGEMNFALGKNKINVTMMGWQGKIIRAPDFLDDLTKKGQALIAEASSGQGNVGENLRRAARLRILREIIIIAAGQHAQRKALSKMLLRYPVGISSDKLLQLLMQATHALQIITRKPRWIGLGIGAAVFGAAAVFYFMTVREILLGQLITFPVNPLWSLAAIDFLLLPFGAVICILCAQLAARAALKKTLTGLASPAAMKRIMPKIGWAKWVALTIAAMIVAACYFFFVLSPA